MPPRPGPQADRTERLAPALSPRAGAASGGWRQSEPVEERSRPRLGPPRRRGVALALLALLLALLPALAIALWATAPSAAELEERWRRGAGFDPLTVFPSREANATALRIEEIVRPLGLELAPYRSPRRPRLRPGVAIDLEPLWSGARPTLHALRTGKGPTQALPAPAQAALDAVGGDLSAVREALLGAEPPRWERDLEAGYNAPFPDLLAHQRLHRLLVLAAHRAALAGEPAEAAAWLEGAWRLHGSLADEPHLGAQLFAASELQDELALLRAMPRPPAGWRERLAAHAVRPRVHRSLRIEAWLAVRSVARGAQIGRSLQPPEGYVLRRLLAPLWWARVRHGVGHLVTAIDGAIARAEGQGAAVLDAEFARRERHRVPPWSRVGRQMAGSLLDAPVQAARADLGVELTGQLLDLAARRDRGEPPAPATVPSAVPGVLWQHELAGGRLTVRPSREVPSLSPHPLSLRAALSWPATRTDG
jgi:hypothetical protein